MYVVHRFMAFLFCVQSFCQRVYHRTYRGQTSVKWLSGLCRPTSSALVPNVFVTGTQTRFGSTSPGVLSLFEHK